MANINVRGISDQTKQALRVRAAKAGMSLEAFARQALNDAAVGRDAENTHLVDLASQYFGAEHGAELEPSPRSTQREPVDFA